MDSLALKIDSTGGYRHVMPSINERSLLDMVREHEMPFAKAERSVEMAGGYLGLSPEDVLFPSRHLLGEPIPYYEDEGKTVLLVCGGCLESGCWPLLAHVTVTDATVVWSDFEQPHRSPGSGAPLHWRYDDFGPFTFERRAYEQALRA